MPTTFFRTKLKPKVSRADYNKWVADFVYPHVQKIPSVLEHHIYPISGPAVGKGAAPYDNIEVITVSDVNAYHKDLQTNPAAAAIGAAMPKYVDVLDSAIGDAIAPGFVRAAATKEPAKYKHKMKCRTGQHVNSAQVFPVPSNPPIHTVGSGQGAGLAFFENGDVAALTTGFNVDFPDGKSGTHALYTQFAFEDGSQFVILEVGTQTSPDGKTADFLATSITFIEGSGAGRFAGITGGGTMTGKRYGSFGPSADTTLNYEFSYSLPGD
jgi:hypothetical protein